MMDLISQEMGSLEVMVICALEMKRGGILYFLHVFDVIRSRK